MTTIRLLFLLTAAIAGACLRPAQASAQVRSQDTLRIAAIVNNDIISIYDLRQRTLLTEITSNIPDTPENQRRLAPQVLRTLIDERLKMQEAKRLNLNVTPAEIDEVIAKIERGNKMTPGQMKDVLIRNGARAEDLRDRIEADIAWNKVIGSQLARNIRISDEEVDDVLRQIEANKGRPEYLAAEIVLPVDSPNHEREVRQLADRLIRQLQSGTPFQALAQNFSRSATAAVGGDLGWVKSGEIDAEIEAALVRLKPGEISEPVHTEEGFTILLLRDRRASQGVAELSDLVNLTQIIVPVLPKASKTQEAVQLALAESLSKPATSCADMERAAKNSGSPMSGSLGTVPIDSLPADVRAAIKDVPLRTPTTAQRTKDGFRVLMVCERKKSDAVTAQRDRIRDRLMDERMAVQARRYMRDLRRAAFIDVRV